VLSVEAGCTLIPAHFPHAVFQEHERVAEWKQAKSG